jgi:hypothetical protein
MYNIRLFGIETRNSPLYNEYMLIKMKKKSNVHEVLILDKRN